MAKVGQKLTAQQERFCYEYLIDGVASHAVVRAGYKSKRPDVIGSQLLSNPKVLEKLDDLRLRQQNRLGIESDEVVKEMLRIARCDIIHVLDENQCLKDIQAIPEDTRRAISSIEVAEEFTGRGNGRELSGYVKKIKFWDKNKALENLCKHYGLFAKDNDQRKGLTIIEILALIDGNSNNRRTQVDSRAV